MNFAPTVKAAVGISDWAMCCGMSAQLAFCPCGTDRLVATTPAEASPSVAECCTRDRRGWRRGFKESSSAPSACGGGKKAGEEGQESSYLHLPLTPLISHSSPCVVNPRPIAAHRRVSSMQRHDTWVSHCTPLDSRGALLYWTQERYRCCKMSSERPIGINGRTNWLATLL